MRWFKLERWLKVSPRSRTVRGGRVGRRTRRLTPDVLVVDDRLLLSTTTVVSVLEPVLRAPCDRRSSRALCRITRQRECRLDEVRRADDVGSRREGAVTFTERGAEYDCWTHRRRGGGCKSARPGSRIAAGSGGHNSDSRPETLRARTSESGFWRPRSGRSVRRRDTARRFMARRQPAPSARATSGRSSPRLTLTSARRSVRRRSSPTSRAFRRSLHRP